MRRYEISGGDGGAYGPAFGPITVFEIGIVEDAEGFSWQLVQLETCLEYDGQRIEYFVLSPRYRGDGMRKLQEKGCMVGVSRVLPGRLGDVRGGAVADNVDYWAVAYSSRLAS